MGPTTFHSIQHQQHKEDIMAFTLNKTEQKELTVTEMKTIAKKRLIFISIRADHIETNWELLDESGAAVGREIRNHDGDCTSLLETIEEAAMQLLQSAGKLAAGTVDK